MTSARVSDQLAGAHCAQSSCPPTCVQNDFIDEKSLTLAHLSGTWVRFRSELLGLIDEFEEQAADALDMQSMTNVREHIESFHNALATRVLPLDHKQV